MSENLEAIIEAILFTAGEPISIERLQQLINLPTFEISAQELKASLENLAARYENSGIKLVEVASGYRFQARSEFIPWLQRLHARKSIRYSRAFLETLALIVYRQPLTRGEIEEVRGVSVSTQIIKSLLELEWIRLVGYRDVPGRPALYATTQKFLDDFNLKSLNELPVLQEPRSLEQLEQSFAGQLELESFVPE